jgi:RecJ-like exonuclease
VTTRLPPRRWSAAFTDDNDHDPWVLEDCADCGGRGSICVEENGVVELGTCPTCGGRGASGEVTRYFARSENGAAAPIEVESASDTIACPGCHAELKLRDARAWTGRRHVACGQSIRIVRP